MRRSAALALLALALARPGGALAASSDPIDSVVQTAIAAAITREADPETLRARAGKPDADYLFRALQGEIDVFVQKQDNGAVAEQLRRGEQAGRRVVDLRAMEWRGKDCSCTAILLFKERKFIYAMLPVSGSEDTAEDLANRFADKPKILELAGPGVRAKLYAYPDRGVGYVATGPGPFAFKVVFPEGVKAADFRGAILGGGKAPGAGSNVRAPAVSAPRATPVPAKPPRR